MSLYESTDDIPEDAVQEHYERALPVYRELGNIEDDEDVLDSLLVPGTSTEGIRAWYKSTEDPELVDGSDGAGRPYIARADADDVPTEVLEWDHPTVFSTINYQPVNPDDWTPYRWDDGREWTDEKPLPEYQDIRALALFADVDFDADAKTRPVDDETRALVEDALGQWVDAYASAVGDRTPVHLLDSVGGTYVMLAPRVTAPILDWAHETLEPDEREQLIDELAARWRDFNADIQDDVAEEIPELTGVFELDGNTNKNRLYKAPLALHKSLPGVVTPIDTGDIQFRFTPVEDVDDGLVAECTDWAADFTHLPARDETDSLEQYAENLVATLFPDLFTEVGSEMPASTPWRIVLRRWLQQRQAEREARAELTLEDLDVDIDADELELTDEADAPFTAAEALDVEQVAGQLGIISDSEQAQRDDATRIEVNWRQSDSGDSAIVQEEHFTDLSDHSGGDAADLVAWTTLGSSNSKPTGWRQDGEKVSEVLDKLRELGNNIPVYVPAQGGSYTVDGETKTRSETPNWALAKVAKLLDLAPDAAIDEETDEITVPTLYNRVLAVLDHHGIDHGRTPKDVHVDAAGDDVVAAEQDINVADYEPDASDLDGPDWVRDGAVETDHDGADGAQEPPTWTARYGIHERSFMDGDKSPYDVQLPGCEDLVWIEYETYGKRTAGYAYRTETDEGNIYYDHIINADLELVSRLTYPDQDDRDEEWELRINPTDPREPPKTITVDPSAFNSPRDFREEIKGKSGSMRFDAHRGHQTVDALKTLVNAQDAPRRKAYARIKLIHEDIEQPLLVTPAGTLGPDGWVKDPEHVWGDMAEGDVIDKWELSPELDDYDQDAAREVAELLPETRVAERFLPILGYVFASTFRSPITETSITATDKWAHTQGFGDTGAGKSSMGEKLWECIGMEGELIKAKKTPHSALVTLSSTNTVPLLLDEYKPSGWRQHKADAFHEYMRDASTGSTTTKTWNYPVQKTYHLDTSVALFGEGRFPSDANALARRTIETTLSQRATTPETSMYEAFKELATTLADDGEKATLHHALAWWSFVLQRADDKLELIEEWEDARTWALEEMEHRGHDLTEVLDRDMYRQQIQTVAFGVRLWRDFAQDVLDADPEKLPSDSELGDAIEYMTMRKNDENAINRSDRDVLFELAARAASKLDDGAQEYLERGEHYGFVHEDVDARPTELRLHLRSVVEELNRYVRDYGLDTDVASKNDYYSWIKEAADDPDSYCLGVGKVTYGKRMVAVDWEQLEDDLDVMKSDFLPWLSEETIQESEDSSDDDDSDGDGDGDSSQSETTPLEDVEDGDTTTVSVRIDEPETDTPDAIATEATAVDQTADLRLVIWESSDCGTELEDGDHYRISDVDVSEYEGSLELHVQDDTAFQAVSQGVGYTPAADAGENATLADQPTNSDEAATDGGDRADADSDVPADAEGRLADARHLVKILNQSTSPLSETELIARATTKTNSDLDPDRAKDALDYAVTEKGMIINTDDGYTSA